jgi:hypothetical protein
VATVDLHTYGETVLYPYGFTAERPPTAAGLEACAVRMRDAITAAHPAAAATADDDAPAETLAPAVPATSTVAPVDKSDDDDDLSASSNTWSVMESVARLPRDSSP